MAVATPGRGVNSNDARRADLEGLFAQFQNAGGAWAHSGDSIVAHADGYTGAITWYSIDERGATVIERARLGRPGREIAPDDMAVETARMQGIVSSSRARESPIEALAGDSAALLAVPPLWSVATKALFASDGSLWVGINRIYDIAVANGLALRVGEENTWAVFPAMGTAFTVMLRPLFRLTAVVGDRIYGYVDDGVTAPAVLVFSLR